MNKKKEGEKISSFIDIEFDADFQDETFIDKPYIYIFNKFKDKRK